jgi:hypothetical protein
MTTLNDDDTLRWQLQALRRDLPPSRDLWPDIATRIASTPRQPAVAQHGARRVLPWALAASVLLAVGLAWQLVPVSSPAANGVQVAGVHAVDGNPLIREQAVSMAIEYEGALARIEQAGTHPEMQSALGDLDRSAALILAAIDHDPEARFLLEQLRRTYARRLQLTQRAALT